MPLRRVPFRQRFERDYPGVLQRILGMREKGFSVTFIADVLNQEGIHGRRGGKFFSSSIARILRHVEEDPPSTDTEHEAIVDTTPASGPPQETTETAFFLERIITVLERTDARFALVESRLASLEQTQAAQAELLLEQLADFSTKTVDITKTDLVDAVRPLGDAMTALHDAQAAEHVKSEARLVERIVQQADHWKALVARLDVQADRLLPLAALSHLDAHIKKGVEAVLKDVVVTLVHESFEHAVDMLSRRLSIADTFLKQNLEAIGKHNRLFSEVMERDDAKRAGKKKKTPELARLGGHGGTRGALPFAPEPIEDAASVAGYEGEDDE